MEKKMIKRFAFLLACCCVCLGVYAFIGPNLRVTEEMTEEDEELVAERDRPDRHDEERQTLYDKNKERIREEEQEAMRNRNRYDYDSQDEYPTSFNPYYPQ